MEQIRRIMRPTDVPDTGKAIQFVQCREMACPWKTSLVRVKAVLWQIIRKNHRNMYFNKLHVIL